jgi:hypothetical protein
MLKQRLNAPSALQSCFAAIITYRFELAASEIFGVLPADRACG